MTSLGEVQRIIGLSLSKIQMGRNQRGGLPLHKNLLVATVLNKARDVYMQETMYMNYRLMACGQFNQEEHEDIEDDETPDAEDYEEDSESDVEDDNDSSASKDYSKEFVGPSCVGSLVPGVGASGLTQSSAKLESSPVSPGSGAQCCVTPAVTSAQVAAESVTSEAATSLGLAHTQGPDTSLQQTSDEGFIDETDCDCDTRNFSEDGETRVPFQYCFSCAPFHPSNGRGPTLVGPNQQQVTNPCPVAQPSLHQEQEDKLIYDMDLKSTQNQPSSAKRKRQISSEETEDAISSILPKKRRDSGSENLDDSGYQEEEKVAHSFIFVTPDHGFHKIFPQQVFHPAFRDGGVVANGMEVDQITSLVSIFSFGQQVFASAESSQSSQKGKKTTSSKDEDDSDSDSDTSSDSGHSSDDQGANNDDKSETPPSSSSTSLDCSARSDTNNSEMSCLAQAQAKDKDLEVSSVSVAAAV